MFKSERETYLEHIRPGLGIVHLDQQRYEHSELLLQVFGDRIDDLGRLVANPVQERGVDAILVLHRKSVVRTLPDERYDEVETREHHSILPITGGSNGVRLSFPET